MQYYYRTPLLIILALVFGTLLYSPSVQAATYDELYIINCVNRTERYFIRPSGILYVLTGIGGKADCMVAVDTEGRQRMLCNIPTSEDTCSVAEVLII